MKNYLLASALLFSFFSFSQETEDTDKNRPWDISMSFKLGNGKQYSEEFQGLNGNINAADFLLTYTFGTPNENSFFRVSSGVSLMDFDANLMMGNNLVSYRSSYLQVPLRFGSQLGVFNQDVVRLVADFGFAGNYHMESTFETVAEREKIRSKGWTFAFISTLGFDVNLSERSKAGIFVDLHSPIISDDAAKNHRLPLQAQMLGISFKYML